MNRQHSPLADLAFLLARRYVAEMPRTFEPSRKNGRLLCYTVLSSTRLKDELFVFVQGTLAALRCPRCSLPPSIFLRSAPCVADLYAYSREGSIINNTEGYRHRKCLARSANETRDRELLPVIPSAEPGMWQTLLTGSKCKRGCHLNFILPRLATPVLKLTSLVLSSTGSTVPLLHQSTIYSTSSIKC